MSMLPLRAAFAGQIATLAPNISLLSALTLQGNATAGGTSVSVDLSVGVGDVLVFDKGQASEETRTITAVSGAGPYTATVAALGFAHSSGTFVSHLPNASATVHELTVTRVASNWTGPAGGTSVVVASPSAVSVPINAIVGAVSLHSALTAGTYQDSTAVACQKFASAGTYQPTYTATVS